MPDHGDNFFHDLDKLHQSQKHCIEFILKEVYRIAVEEARRENQASSSVAYRKEQHFRRPHQVFVIEGKRGSGKTTTLITAYRHLQLLGAVDGVVDGHKDPRMATLQRLGVDTEITARGEGRVRRNGTMVVPIIMPNELANDESVMENLFAQIEAELIRVAKEEVKIADSRKGRALWEKEELEPSGAITAETLIEELHNDISVGWTYSQRIGLKALVNDSLNYRDYVERRAEQARISYTRVEAWRGFVNKLLDYLNCEVMVICIDDSDLSPHIGEDILHALRMYLSHPRIVTLLAINLETLVDGLERVEFARLYQMSQVLIQADKKQELKNVQRNTRRSIRDYVHKILPIGFRKRLSAGELAFDNLFLEKFKQSFSEVVNNNIDITVNQIIQGSKDFSEWCENNLIFWSCLAGNKDVLYSDNIREMVDIIDWLNRQNLDDDVAKAFIELRLSQPSMVDCADVLHLPFAESLYKSAVEKKLQLAFLNDVIYKLPNTVLEDEDAQREFLSFILRVELALNRLNVPLWLRALIPSSLIPVHPAEEFYQPIRDLMTVGVSSVFSNGTLIPRNCLYIDDFSQILRNDYYLSIRIPVKQYEWLEILKNGIKLDLKRYMIELGDNPNLHHKFRNALFYFHTNDYTKTILLSACYILYHLKDSKSLDPTQMRALNDSFLSSSILKSSSPDNQPFMHFIQQAQQFLQRQAYIFDAISGIIANALVVADIPIADEDTIKKAENFADRERRIDDLLNTLINVLTTQEQGLRKRVLLAWAVLPHLPHWLVIEGVRDEKTWQQLKSVLAVLDSKIKEIDDKERRREFPEFSDELLSAIVEEVSRGMDEFAKTLKAKDSIHAFTDDADFYGLTYKQQIAFLLKTTVRQSEAFLEYVGRA